MVYLFLLLSINSFASVVSDNEGSSLITKPELDALKSTFQSQIDVFNKSIDIKIDQGIISYLEGVNVSNKRVERVISNDWSEVVFMNGVIEPTFRLPELNAIVGYAQHSAHANSNRKQFAFCAGFYNDFIWNVEDGETCLRPLFGEMEIENQVKKYWDGIALRYHEKITASVIKHILSFDMAGLDWQGDVRRKISFNNFFKFSFSGDDADTSSDNFFNPTIQYRFEGSAIPSIQNISFNQKKVDARVILDEYNGKTIDYEHIIQYNGNNSWCLSNEKAMKTFKVHPNNNFTDTNLYAKTNIEGNYYAGVVGFCPPAAFVGGILPNTSFQNSASKLTSFGMLNNNIKANEIYQFDKASKEIRVNSAC